MNKVTLFKDIYGVFFSKVSDYDLATLNTVDIEEILYGYLMSACSRFDVCRQDLTQLDTDNQCFLVKLTFEEIEILATHMVCCWLEPKLNDLDLLRNRLNTKDFTFFSPTNLLSAIRTRYNEACESARLLTNDYSYKQQDFSNLIKK